MWDGKKKAITFSFDDGCEQDIEFVRLLDKYKLKGTFNLNSGLLGNVGKSMTDGVETNRNKVLPNDVKSVYKGHEVAAHTISHPSLLAISAQAVTYQVETDRRILSNLCGYDVVGMAYPGGPPNSSRQVADVIKRSTGIKYARAYEDAEDFYLPTELYLYHPTVEMTYMDRAFELIEKFLSSNDDKPQLFCLWGHTFHLDSKKLWGRVEEFLSLVSGRKDIFYGTNKEVLLDR